MTALSVSKTASAVNRDTSGLLYGQRIGLCGTAVYGTGSAQCAAKEQKLLGKAGLACVYVGKNTKIDLLFRCHAHHISSAQFFYYIIQEQGNFCKRMPCVPVEHAK